MNTPYQDCTVLHVDADGFFAAVEQALDPALRGRPVVTGAERGIIAAASYEAKALGIKRGIQLSEARRLCPELVIVPSDYEAYGLYSQKMFAILRRFTPLVEEYSIDEAFADLDGCADVLAVPQEVVAERLRHAVATELGLTVSVGVSLTKTLAKLCSKFRKPNGQTILKREHVPLLLKRTPVDAVWGIGPSSASKLKACGVATAYDFTRMEESTVLRMLHKPGWQTWRELHGRRMFPITTEAKQRYDSMMTGHTFAPPAGDPAFVYAEALRNLTTVFAKLRRHGHLARQIGLYLRLKDYNGKTAAATLPVATSRDCEAVPALRTIFDAIFEPGAIYRSTTIWLGGLEPERGRQLDLFEETSERRRYGELTAAMDRLNQRYGRNAVAPAALLDGRLKPWHPRDTKPARYDTRMASETERHLVIPRMTLSNPV